MQHIDQIEADLLQILLMHFNNVLFEFQQNFTLCS